MNAQKKTNHHILPRSRYPELEKVPKNVVKVKHHRHDLFHQLFSNLLPEEILDTLVNEFWGGNKEFIKNYCHKNCED